MEPLSKAFALGKANEVYCLSVDSLRRQLFLWRGTDDGWTVSRMTEFEGRVPNFGAIRMDSQGRPVVVVGLLDEPFGWVKVLRPSGSTASKQ